MELARANYLTRYYDPELSMTAATTKELEAAQLDRLKRSLQVVVYAGSIPRRLGGEASDRELAIDRKRARRVGHALKQSIGGWSKKQVKLQDNNELRIEGAQLIWPDWFEAYLVRLDNEVKLVVSWAIRNDQQRWGRSAVVKFENELNWITYAMRD